MNENQGKASQYTLGCAYKFDYNEHPATARFICIKMIDCNVIVIILQRAVSFASSFYSL